MARIQGTEASLEWYREGEKNRYVHRPGEGWDEDVRSCSLLHPFPTVRPDGTVSLARVIWEELHIPATMRRKRR